MGILVKHPIKGSPHPIPTQVQLRLCRCDTGRFDTGRDRHTTCTHALSDASNLHVELGMRVNSCSDAVWTLCCHCSYPQRTKRVIYCDRGQHAEDLGTCVCLVRAVDNRHAQLRQLDCSCICQTLTTACTKQRSLFGLDTHA